MGGELKLKYLIIPTIQLLQLAKLTVFYFNKKKKKRFQESKEDRDDCIYLCLCG